MMILTILGWGVPGGGELILIFGIILLLFGAKRLPELARSLGQAKKEFTKAAAEATEELDKMKQIQPPSSPSPNIPKNGDSAKKA